MANGTVLNLGSGGDTVQNIDNGAIGKTPVAVLTDGTGTTFAAVKATTALASDPALVVAVSPSNDAVQLLNVDIAAKGVSSAINTQGFGSVVFQLADSLAETGVAIGTVFQLTIEGSNDGITWDTLLVNPVGELIGVVDALTSYGSYVIQVSHPLVRFNCTLLSGGKLSFVAVGRTDAGVLAADALTAAFDPNNPLYVGLTNIKRDAGNALVLSDAPAPIFFQGVVGSIYTIDTTGYNSINLQTNATAAATVTHSDDGVNFQALTGTPHLLGTYVTALTASAGFSFPCLSRFIRVTFTTGGSVTGYLRQAQWQAAYTTSPIAYNVSQLGGTAVVTGGVAGIQAVGGNIAVGAAPTANPVLSGGVDTSGLTRRVLTDTAGRLIVDAAYSPLGVASTLGALPSAANATNTAALNVQETTQIEGQGIVELLYQILVELRINNQYQYDLPRNLNAGMSQVDEPQAFRNDPTVFTQ